MFNDLVELFQTLFILAAIIWVVIVLVALICSVIVFGSFFFFQYIWDFIEPFLVG